MHFIVIAQRVPVYRKFTVAMVTVSIVIVNKRNSKSVNIIVLLQLSLPRVIGFPMESSRMAVTDTLPLDSSKVVSRVVPSLVEILISPLNNESDKR